MKDITNTPINQSFKKEPISILKLKGKGAFSTENRRLTWELVVWPLFIHLNRSYFTLNEFRIKKTEICRKYRMKGSSITGGLVSLTNKGFLTRDHVIYSINFRLLSYLTKKVDLDYSIASRKIASKK